MDWHNDPNHNVEPKPRVHDADWTKRYAPIVTDDDGTKRVSGPVTR